MKALVVSSFNSSPKYSSFLSPISKGDEVVITVLAAGLHPLVKSIAKGEHYRAKKQIPFIPGIDGVGRLEDGSRVYFGTVGSMYGSMAEKTVAKKGMCMPLPEEVDSVTAAAVFNPGLSSWLALIYKAQLVENEIVLINGATGVAGRIAIQIAKFLGAKKVIATGRNKKALEGLSDCGADILINLDRSKKNLIDDILQVANGIGIDVVIDYLWGVPAEIIIAALSQRKVASSRTRFVQLGDSAGKSIELPASALRSSQIELSGSGIGSTPIEHIIAAVPKFTKFVASKDVKIFTRQISLAEAEDIWEQTPPDGCRFVVVP